MCVVSGYIYFVSLNIREHSVVPRFQVRNIKIHAVIKKWLSFLMLLRKSSALILKTVEFPRFKDSVFELLSD